jgi:hypothetical protein
VVEGLDGPLYGWIKLGLEEYFDPDLASMKRFAATVNEITRGVEASVLRSTVISVKVTDGSEKAVMYFSISDGIIVWPWS